jgi:hypothetical protein
LIDRIPALAEQAECAGQTRSQFEEKDDKVRNQGRLRIGKEVCTELPRFLLTVGEASATEIPQNGAQGAQQISRSGIAPSGDCGLSISDHVDLTKLSMYQFALLYSCCQSRSDVLSVTKYPSTSKILEIPDSYLVARIHAVLASVAGVRFGKF